MFFIAWTDRQNRTDVGAVRSSALLVQLKRKYLYPTLIPIWGSDSLFTKIKWVISTLFQLIKSRRQLVYVSCSPYNHLLIVLLGVLIRKHELIVDFRDAYSIDIKERNGPGNYTWAKFIEKIIYRYCSKFIVVTPGAKERYKKIFKSDDKIMVASNGHEVDRDFMNRLAAKYKKDDNYIKVVYPGIYSTYFSDEKAKNYITVLKNELQKTGKNYEIVFVGTDEKTKKIFKGEKNIKFIPNTLDGSRLSYEETIEILNQADLAFMPIDNDYGCATKIFDYLALGLPIFNFIHKDNWMHEYIGDRIVDTCDNLKRFEMDFSGIYHRDVLMKKIADYIYEEAIKIKDPACRRQKGTQ